MTTDASLFVYNVTLIAAYVYGDYLSFTSTSSGGGNKTQTLVVYHNNDYDQTIGICYYGYVKENEIYCFSDYWEPAYPQQLYINCTNSGNTCNFWNCEIIFWNKSRMKIGPFYLQQHQSTTTTSASSSSLSGPSIILAMILMILMILN